MSCPNKAIGLLVTFCATAFASLLPSTAWAGRDLRSWLAPPATCLGTAHMEHVLARAVSSTLATAPPHLACSQSLSSQQPTAAHCIAARTARLRLPASACLRPLSASDVSRPCRAWIHKLIGCRQPEITDTGCRAYHGGPVPCWAADGRLSWLPSAARRLHSPSDRTHGVLQQAHLPVSGRMACGPVCSS